MKAVRSSGRHGVVPFLLLLAGALAAGGCGGRIYLVSSLGPARAIVVDGRADDWGGALSYAAKERVFVGFVNDRDSLYVCMTREETGGRPGAPAAGVAIWIDPLGGTRKALGIRLAETPGEPGGKERTEEPSDQERAPDVEVLGPNGNVVRILSPEEAAEAGLEVRAGFSGGSYILEAKIPLRATPERPVAVGAGPEGVIGVGFVGSRPGHGGRLEAPPGGAMPPGGVGGIGVRGTGGSGGMQPGLRPNRNPDIGESLKFWTQVRLNPGS